MKKIKFYFLSIFILFLIFELLSFASIKIIKNKVLLSNTFSQEYKPKIIENYSEFIPYSRNVINFSELNNYIVKNDNSFFYSVIRNFDNKNKNNILIQGDSWAEVANKKKIFSYLIKYSDKHNVGIINAGISSYSPSPMTSQLYILEKEFEIKPSIIIAIIDQTDIGDELYRYYTLEKNSFSPSLTKIQRKFYLESNEKFKKSNLFSLKLINFIYSYFLFQKEIYNNNSFNAAKIIFKKIKSKLFGVPLVLSPLKFGINEIEKNIFKSKLNNYINLAFQNSDLKRIYFVTHPHVKHLNKEFKTNVNTIIDEIINENKKKDIIHLDFEILMNSFDMKIFLKGDEFSHLTENAYANYYYPKIFNKIK
tara:strand:- start:3936 stop:5030 length:1095 start_codon:yes stop_codon:yes gene_type:complete